MKIAVMGSGGVGGYFGARLAAAGSDVTFIARGRHLDAMRAHGLRLDSVIEPLHLPRVKAVASAAEIDSAEAVLFAVKMADTETAARSLAPLVAKGASVLTFQNGVESVDKLAAILGREAVVPGVARVAAHISEPGVVKEAGGFASLSIGERDGESSARTAAFHAACTAAGIDCRLSDRIEREVWMKFALLAPLAAMTSLARGPIGPMRTTAESRELLHAAVREVIAVGEAMKTGVGPADTDGILKMIDGVPATMMSSMSHDLVAGKPLELDGLSGAVVRLGAAAGVPTPTHRFVVQALAPFAKGRPQVG